MEAAAAVATKTSLREFEGRWIDEGYEFLGVGSESGWRAVAGWGKDGWDLGDWPYVVVLFREQVEAFQEPPPQVIFQRAIYCEGDIVIESYLTALGRERATDETAMFYWRAAGEPWIEERPAEDLRGPYRG